MLLSHAVYLCIVVCVVVIDLLNGVFPPNRSPNTLFVGNMNMDSLHFFKCLYNVCITGCSNVAHGAGARKAAVRIVWFSMDSVFACRCFAPMTRDGVCVVVTTSTQAPLFVPTQVTM